MLKNKTNIYFLSRDGYIPKIIYDKLSKIYEGLPNSKYLYTSRASYQIPNLLNINKNIAVDALTQRNVAVGQMLSIGEVFENVGIDISKEPEVLRDFGFDTSGEIITDDNIHEAKKMVAYKFEEIKKILVPKLQLLEEYLKQEGLYDFEKVNLFDIGWRGSIQYAIKKITKLDVDGYYFGTSEFAYPEVMSNSYGYIHDLGVPYKIKDFVMSNLMMFELIFSSSEPSLIGFEKKSDKIVPIFSKKDVTHDLIDVFQKASIDIIDSILKYSSYFNNFDKYFFYNRFANFIIERKYEDVKEFRILTNNVGYSEVKKEYVKEYKVSEIEDNFDKFVKEVSISLWRNAFYIDDSKKYHEIISKLENQCLYLTPKKKLISLSNLRKAWKNPRKAFHVASLKIKNIFRNKNNYL